MIVSLCIIYMFAVLLNKVSLEVTVEHFVGDSAILPCLYTEDKTQVKTVNWVYDHHKNVYVFSPGFSGEVKYDNRTESFPKEYEKGNYSIKIRNLEKTDAGIYTCLITPADYFENIHLTVNPKGEPFIIVSDKQSTQKSQKIIVVIVICVVIFICFSFLLILRHKNMWIFKTRKHV